MVMACYYRLVIYSTYKNMELEYEQFFKAWY